MDIIIKILQLLLSLSILVVIHEFGHFAAAKIFKTRVEKFYLFFNPWFSLFKYKKGETEYGIGWLPLGGYVKIAGMIDESMDKEQMAKEPQPWEFRTKPAWQRLIIMLGGVIMNVVLAIVIYTVMMASYGEEYLPTSALKYGVQVDSVGYSLGLRNGDKILSLDGKEVEDFMKIPATILFDEVQSIQIERQGKQMDIAVPASFVKTIIESENTSFIMPRVPVRIMNFTETSKAAEAGLQSMDWIQSINGAEVKFRDQFAAFQDSVKAHVGNMVQVEVRRGDEPLSFEVAVPESGLIGIGVGVNLDEDFEMKSHQYNVVQAVPAGFNKAYETMDSYLKQLKMMFNPELEAYKSVGGFITIGKIFPGTWDWMRFWYLTAFLSIVLAIMNVLPIPALDGGHVMFLLYEIIAGRKPSDKFMEYAQMVGMFILFALLIFANGNDIWKLFN